MIGHDTAACHGRRFQKETAMFTKQKRSFTFTALALPVCFSAATASAQYTSHVARQKRAPQKQAIFVEAGRYDTQMRSYPAPPPPRAYGNYVQQQMYVSDAVCHSGRGITYTTQPTCTRQSIYVERPASRPRPVILEQPMVIETPVYVERPVYYGTQISYERPVYVKERCHKSKSVSLGISIGKTKHHRDNHTRVVVKRNHNDRRHGSHKYYTVGHNRGHRERGNGIRIKVNRRRH